MRINFYKVLSLSIAMLAYIGVFMFMACAVNNTDGDTDGNITFVVTNTAQWNNAINAIRGPVVNNKKYLITVSGNFDVPEGSGYSVWAPGITITLNGSGTVSLIGTGSLFYLFSDQTLIIDSPDLILKGNDSNNCPLIEVGGGSTLELRNGLITGNTGEWGGGVRIGSNGTANENGGTFNMYGGAISNCNAICGGAVNVWHGSFIMTGGTISGNRAQYGGGLYVTTTSGYNYNTFPYSTFPISISGGTISDNIAEKLGGGVYLDSRNFSMADGTISGNTAPTGGGVYLAGGNFNLNCGTISNNTAENYGGGVYASGGSFEISGGTICNNSGSGVYVIYNNKLIMSDGEISGNTSNIGGGGVYVESGSTFTLNGGVITGNTASNSYGGGVWINSRSSNFTMNGGIILGNTAYKGGGVAALGYSISLSLCFNKTGGIIYGNNEGSDSNTALANNTSGNSVYYLADTYNQSSSQYYRNTTLGESDDICTFGDLPANSGNTLKGWTKL